MKLLLLGDIGWIGNKFKQYINEKHNEIEIITCNIKIRNNNFENDLLKIAPTHIVSFIGRTSGTINNKEYKTIDFLEQPGTLNVNVRDNLYVPVMLSLLCKKHNIHFTNISTGCIYNQDDMTQPFHENDLPNFKGSNYSTMKGYTDQLLNLLDDVTLNFRIRLPITNLNEPKNLITKITKYKKICSFPNSMTVLDDVFPIIIDMSKKRLTGTYNLTNPGIISHNEILQMYKELVDNNFEWSNYSDAEQNTLLAAKRCNNYLCTKKIESLYPNFKNIKDSLKDILLNYK